MKEIKVFFQKGPCLNIDGIDFIHHLNGGGLKAVTAEVDDNVYLGPGVIVKDKVKISGERIEIIGPSIIIKDKVKISGKEIRIVGIVEIKPNIEILGEKISIFGYGCLAIVKGFNKTDLDIYGKGTWSEV